MPGTSGLSASLPTLLVENAVRAALLEDIGRSGDITTQATIAHDARAQAEFSARSAGTLAGIDFIKAAYAALDSSVKVELEAIDGARLGPGVVVARVEGPAAAILTGERVALNFLGHLSGVATATAAFADEIAHTKARICCTRKTTPGLRAFEKYAVKCGGGSNHRFGLDDAILIKDNHIAVAGGGARAVELARDFAGHLVKIEVEVDTLAQLRDVLAARPDVVLLDNMATDILRQAVDIVAGSAATEASGGITLQTVRAVAETGVDYISTGWITHSAPVLDLGLDINM